MLIDLELEVAMSSKRCIRRRAERCHTLRSFLRTHNACGRKDRFDTFEAASVALESLLNCNYYDGLPMNVYRCPLDPSHFHFGHLPKGRRYGC